MVKRILSFTTSDYVISSISAVVAIILTKFLEYYYAIGLFIIFNFGLYYWRYKQENKLGLYDLKEDFEKSFDNILALINHPEGKIKYNFQKFVTLLRKENNELADKLIQENNAKKLISNLLADILRKIKEEKPNTKTFPHYLHILYTLIFYIQKEYLIPAYDIVKKENIKEDVENMFNDMLSEYDTLLKLCEKIKSDVEKLTKEKFTEYYFQLEKIREVKRSRYS